ncbi:MAG: 4-hydroxy-tetrahydrodipicolinate synthase [Actinomycetota bacterium]|nr:4-hydroxy-tetrahydrodipicolinate synthase [Actinomycetota bacterium]
MKLSGVWLPIVTPFYEDQVDYLSYDKLLDHYLDTGIAGLVLLGTTGEALALDDDESERFIGHTLARLQGQLPVFVGLSDAATRKVVKTVNKLARFDVDGFLAPCPYYVRPSQRGIVQHFAELAGATEKPLIVYNIPYRTGVNLSNDALLELARLPNIVAIKDCCGSLAQSTELLGRKPEDFSVLTGEDAVFFTMVCNGAEGGILASAHIATDMYVEVYRRLAANDHHGARETWSRLAEFVPLMFREPNPGPVKYLLYSQGLIRSPECRLPYTEISDGLKTELREYLVTT